MIRPRLERGTDCLEGSCSIQLSYRTDMRTGHECTEMKAQGEGGMHALYVNILGEEMPLLRRAASGTRTHDLFVTNEMLYRLSYCG